MQSVDVKSPKKENAVHTLVSGYHTHFWISRNGSKSSGYSFMKNVLENRVKMKW